MLRHVPQKRYVSDCSRRPCSDTHVKRSALQAEVAQDPAGHTLRCLPPKGLRAAAPHGTASTGDVVRAASSNRCTPHPQHNFGSTYLPTSSSIPQGKHPGLPDLLQFPREFQPRRTRKPCTALSPRARSPIAAGGPYLPVALTRRVGEQRKVRESLRFQEVLDAMALTIERHSPKGESFRTSRGMWWPAAPKFDISDRRRPARPRRSILSNRSRVMVGPLTLQRTRDNCARNAPDS